VLLHGMMGTSETWLIAGYLDALAGDFRLITLDLRGLGRSSASHDPAAYALAEFVADVGGRRSPGGTSRASECLSGDHGRVTRHSSRRCRQLDHR
jgi:pimeloyl-ACP methyl ester carboxylesterase